MLAVVKGIDPKDQVEAMLGAQMAAVHMATMTFARRLAHSETIQHQDSAERTFNKLTRTFASQLEALKRYRTGGEQKVTVKHVTVQEGGQAIVGNVSSGGGLMRKCTNNPMHSKLPMHLSPRCGARTRSQTPCKSPAMPNGRCRMHGGKSTGAPKGNRNAWKHGLYSAEAITFRRLIRRLLSDAADLVERR
jgi:hypothetical protein